MSKNKSFLIALGLCVVTALSGCTSSATADLKNSVKDSTNHVEVIFFHGKIRCKTCKIMERVTRETVDSAFANDVKSRKVVFRVYDIDENEALADDYQAIGSSLFVSAFVNGKEARTDLTEFSLLTARNDTKAYKDSLILIIQTYLNEIQ